MTDCRQNYEQCDPDSETGPASASDTDTAVTTADRADHRRRILQAMTSYFKAGRRPAPGRRGRRSHARRKSITPQGGGGGPNLYKNEDTHSSAQKFLKSGQKTGRDQLEA